MKKIGIDWYYRPDRHKDNPDYHKKDNKFEWCEFDEFDWHKLHPNDKVTVFGINFREESIVYEDFTFRVNTNLHQFRREHFEDENGYGYKFDEIGDNGHYMPMFIKINKKGERK